jgi:hypothetical protein
VVVVVVVVVVLVAMVVVVVVVVVRSSVAIWGTAIQAERSRVRFPTESLGFFIDCDTGVESVSNRNEYQEYFRGLELPQFYDCPFLSRTILHYNSKAKKKLPKF